MSRLCCSRFERAARKLGWTRIAGIDEAGRGALFGPVVAAAVILNPKRRIVGLDRSEERRVGKECRSGGGSSAWRKKHIGHCLVWSRDRHVRIAKLGRS